MESKPSQPGALAAIFDGFKVFNRIIDWITNDRMDLLNIAERINEIVRRSVVHLQPLHTTSAVILNEWEDALLHDVKAFFDPRSRCLAVQVSGV